MSFSYQFERRFAMAHRLLSDPESKCIVPHGHNEYIRCDLRCAQSQTLDHNRNMLLSFNALKSKWHRFIDDHLDHCLQLNQSDPLLDYFTQQEPERLARIVITHGDPTTECLCACLMAKLDRFLQALPGAFYCHTLTLQETPTNTVALSGKGAYLTVLPQGNYWWYRDDFSVNDVGDR